MLTPFLDDIESRIDAGKEEAHFNAWKDFTLGKYRGDVFSPARGYAVPSTLAWPKASMNEAVADDEKMILREFAACSSVLANGKDAPAIMNVRSNYGPGILASVFGCPIVHLEDHYDSSPQATHFGTRDEIKKVLAAGVPDLSKGFGPKVFAVGERYREIMKMYPKMAKYIHVYHPDLQGPIDTLELLWGSNVFYDMYDDPVFIKDLHSLITETYIIILKKWHALFPPRTDGVSVHWGLMHRGPVMLRNDSAMNFSPEQYEEFIRPYDQRIFDEFGGGAIHFCGKGSHYIGAMSKMDKLYGINLSQPHLNDMQEIFRATVEKGIPLIGLSKKVVADETTNGRMFHGLVYAA